MTEIKTEHAHNYYPTRIYELANFYYVITLLECECGKQIWDVGDRVDDKEDE
jgi:hypothetical protein